jgi:hypothetical protein
MVNSRETEWQGWNLMVSRDGMPLNLEQTAMAELGVCCDVTWRNHHGGWYARGEKHQFHLLGLVLSGPHRQHSIDCIMGIAATGRS